MKNSENTEHPYQPNTVSGIAEAPHLRETRNMVKQTRMDTNGPGNSSSRPRPRGGGPRSGGPRSGGPRSGLPRLNPGEKWVLQRSNEY